jgi:hypothetical protein
MKKSGPGSMGKPSPAKPTTKDWSTNKTSKPGSKNTTSAKFEKPAPTRKQTKVAETIKLANKKADHRDKLKGQVAKSLRDGKGVGDAKTANRARFARTYPKGGNI